MADRLQGFVSYSHKDAELYGELKKFLDVAKDLPDFWTDQEIKAGHEWDAAIQAKLKSARVILLLISIDFMNSNYIETVELQEAMRRHRSGEARVIPILLRPVDWEHTPYYEIEALPKELKKGLQPVALTTGAERDAIWVSVIEGIRRSVEDLDKKPSGPAISSEKQKREDEFLHALRALDYYAQTKTFHQFMWQSNKARVGAFLIHGRPGYGQSWLLNRLLDKTGIPNTQKAPFTFSFESNATGIDLIDIWENMDSWLDSEQGCDSLEERIDSVYKLWLEQSIILQLRGIERATEEYIAEFLLTFWKPLVEKIDRAGPREQLPANYLLLFLIDNAGMVESWNGGWQEQFSTSAIPVKLKKIQEFAESDVEGWIENHMDALPVANFTVDTALAKGRIPETALRHISDVCGYKWFRLKNKRL